MMDTLNNLDKSSLLLQLENYQTFLQLHTQLLDNDRLLKEHIVHRMGMLESAILDLEMLEETDDQTKYEQSLGRASRILQGIKVLIEYMLNPNNPPDGIFRSLA